MNIYFWVKIESVNLKSYTTTQKPILKIINWSISIPSFYAFYFFKLKINLKKAENRFYLLRYVIKITFR